MIWPFTAKNRCEIVWKSKWGKSRFSLWIVHIVAVFPADIVLAGRKWMHLKQKKKWKLFIKLNSFSKKLHVPCSSSSTAANNWNKEIIIYNKWNLKINNGINRKGFGAVSCRKNLKMGFWKVSAGIFTLNQCLCCCWFQLNHVWFRVEQKNYKLYIFGIHFSTFINF